MCGIAGFAGLEDREMLEAMTDALAHRGPDDRGFYHQDGVGLGARRLAVIDLEGGRQPIAGELGPVVVFNGEIYNFESIRRGLERRGHAFKTRSDTEVIVHLYEERGVDAFRDLFGMFAIAIWDPRHRELVLARDHVGVKPLYFVQQGRRLFFGSELKALRRVKGLSLEPEPRHIAHYLDYLYVPEPASIYRDVRKLPSGTWLRWRDGDIEMGRFWRPTPRPRPMELPEAAAELDALLTRVVREQAVADVPLGLFLSGGLDSATLGVYLAASGLKPEAFCAFFPGGGQSFNELDKAVKVASVLGLRLLPLPILPEPERDLDSLVEALDEPLADSSALASLWVSREARRHATVALSGVGGDELFGGYPRYLGARLLGTYHRLPVALRAALSRLSERVPEQVSSRNVGGWARRFLSAGLMTPEDAYGRWMGHLDPADRAALYSEALVDGMAAAPRAAFEGTEGDLLQRILSVDLRTYLPDDLLALADRTSMSASLELRVPLCDPRIVEFALSLPSSIRVGRASLKPLLKEVLKDRLPPSILRQKKQGFMVPVGRWLKMELRPALEEGLRGLASRGLISETGARRLADEHLSGKRNRSDVLWAILLLERWFVRHHPQWKIS